MRLAGLLGCFLGGRFEASFGDGAVVVVVGLRHWRSLRNGWCSLRELVVQLTGTGDKVARWRRMCEMVFLSIKVTEKFC